MNSSPTTSQGASFPTSMSGGLELEDGGAFNETPPAVPANSRYWITKKGRVTDRELSDADSSKCVLDSVSTTRSPEIGRTRSGTESDGEMGERRVKQGGETLFVYIPLGGSLFL
jgi:hypothetical protein